MQRVAKARVGVTLIRGCGGTVGQKYYVVYCIDTHVTPLACQRRLGHYYLHLELEISIIQLVEVYSHWLQLSNASTKPLSICCSSSEVKGGSWKEQILGNFAERKYTQKLHRKKSSILHPKKRPSVCESFRGQLICTRCNGVAVASFLQLGAEYPTPRKVRRDSATLIASYQGKPTHMIIHCNIFILFIFILISMEDPSPQSLFNMPKAQQMPRSSRQRPISCRFCRFRKLRCSREAPCSNCVSRGVPCELQHPAAPSPESPSASEPELLERVRRLEELVEIQKSQQNESVKQHPENPDTHAQQTHRSTVSPQLEHFDNDFAWLESIYTGQDLTVNITCLRKDSPSDNQNQDNIPSNKVVFRIRPIQQIAEAPLYINQSAALSSTSFEPLRCIWLPQYPEARILLQKFIRDIDPLYHVVYTPSLPSILDQVYACSNQQGQVKPGNMILLLGIFASSAHSWVERDGERGLFPTAAEANSQSTLWVKATEDVFDIAHRTTCVLIEGI